MMKAARSMWGGRSRVPARLPVERTQRWAVRLSSRIRGHWPASELPAGRSIYTPMSAAIAYDHEKGVRVSTARNGEVDLHFESFGDTNRPTLLLINGLGSQCINYAVPWCQLFCDEGFQVVRFDNRDVGRSTKLDGIDYSLADMADDAVAVLD